MEKSDQKEVEYMILKPKDELWIDTRLSSEEMNFLNQAMLESDKEPYNSELAGNISKSEVIEDKDNWFYETTLKKLTEKLFYRDLDAYYKYYIEKEEPPPKFEMNSLWVNYQKQHEFNPLHRHYGEYSFVIFMKIPTHWKEQHALPISANSNMSCASDFVFVWTLKDSEMCVNSKFKLCPEDEGRMLFFPACLQHMVYPFYGTEEERVTISGNISLYDPNRSKVPEEVFELSDDVYEEKENMLKMMKKGVQEVEEELKSLKKASEKEWSI